MVHDLQTIKFKIRSYPYPGKIILQLPSQSFVKALHNQEQNAIEVQMSVTERHSFQSSR